MYWVLGLFAAFAFSNPASADDWPRLGGPGGSGVSAQTNLLRVWPEHGPRVRWTIDVADGFGGPSIHKGEVFFLDRPNNDKDVLRCLDLKSGQELWSATFDAPGKLPYNGSRNVPTVDAQFVHIIGPFGDFHCIDRKSHQAVWSHNMINEFKNSEIDRPEAPVSREDKLARAQVPMWGFTQAPLLYKDIVMAAPQTQKCGLVAYDKVTGKLRWQSGYVGRNWYCHVSPALVTLDGIDQVIVIGQPSDPEKSPADAPPAIISSIAPDTGRILWSCKTPGPFKIPIPQPLRVDDHHLFLTGGLGMGCLMLKVSHENGQWNTSVEFHKKTVASFIHSPILYQDHLYAISSKDHGGLQTGLVCLDLQGNSLWETGPGLQFDFGSFLVADGMAIAMHGKSGQLHLIKIAPEGYKLLSQCPVLEARDGMVWAPMALADGMLVVRDQHQMKCLDLLQP